MTNRGRGAIAAGMTVAVVATGLLRGPARSAAELPAAGPSTRPAPSAELARIRQAEIDTLNRAVDLAEQLYMRGLADDTHWDRFSKELLETRLRFAASADERAAVLHDGLTAAKSREALATSRFKAGLCSDMDVAAAQQYRLQIEERLAEMGAK